MSIPNNNTTRVYKQTPRVNTFCVQSHAMKTVGERIRQAREALGWSGLTLAQKVGYSHQSSIGNLENRVGGSGGSKITKIAEALNVSVDWLLQGPDSDEVPFGGKLAYGNRGTYPTPPPLQVEEWTGVAGDPIVREAMQLLQRMSPAGREQSLSYLRFMATQHALSEGGERDSIPHKKTA